MDTQDTIDIAPEDLEYSYEEKLFEAEVIVNWAIAKIPFEATPAQARVMLRNIHDVYASAAEIAGVMLEEKKAVLH